VATCGEHRRGETDSPASASRRRQSGLFTVPIHCSCYNVCQVLMLTALGLAGVGAYRRRAPARHDGLVDFGGYRRQVAARRRHFDLCPAATSGKTMSMVLCGKPTIWIRGESTQEPAHNQSTWAFWLTRYDPGHQTKSPNWLLHRTVRHRSPSACAQGAQK
jgi:hypothetical protein